MNSFTWLVPACFITLVASSLKKPTLSRYTLIALMERKMARVFKGFMSESPKNCSSSCPSGTSPVATSTTAQTKGAIQYTRTRTFPMRALAPNAVASTTLRHERHNIATESAMTHLLLIILEAI